MSYFRYRGKPIESEQELLELYAVPDIEQIPVFNTIRDAKDLVVGIVDQGVSEGHVISVEGSWGSGKTSFARILQQRLSETELHLSFVRFDSLYYGNPSEATTILLDDVFGILRSDFGITVDSRLDIAKNITPEFEVTNGLPKIKLSYRKSRRSTDSILSDGLQHQMRDMNGKLIVVLDDIDRLPPADAVHFLRIVRVLKELPNLIVILPIDRDNLEDLLRIQQIRKPKAYLQKIIDHSFSVDTDQANARQLFERLIARKYPEEIGAHSEFVPTLWNLILWEISLLVIRQFERGENGTRFRMAAGPQDNDTWRLLDPLNLPNGDNLIRKFLEQTGADYGGSTYMIRLTNTQASGGVRKFLFRNYRNICADASFTDFIQGTYVKNVQPQSEDIQLGQTMFDFEWWTAASLGSLSPREADATQVAIDEPVDQNDLQILQENLAANRRYMWDDMAELASQFLPLQVTQFLAARMLNTLVDDLRIDFSLRPGPEFAELQRAVRRVVRRHVDYSRE